MMPFVNETCFSFQAFLNRIFVADPAQRANLEELKSHAWLAGDILPPRALYEELLQRKR